MISKLTNKIFGIKHPGTLRNWTTEDLHIYVKMWHLIFCSIVIATLLIGWLVIGVVTSAG